MKLDSLVDTATQFAERTVAVAAAEDEEVLEAVMLALDRKLAHFLLVGNEEKITTVIQGRFPGMLKNEKITIVHAPSSALSAELAVKAVSEGKADLLMKGNVQTAEILKAVLNKQYGLRTGNILSHVAVFEVPGFERFILVTDAAMNMEPDLQQKLQITKNAVQIAQGIGIETPLVAPIAAVEVVNPKMQATVDAALLTQMNRRGQITSCVIDGPLALDNAVSTLAAEHKGIKSDVAGYADILLVPTLEVGNVLYKSLTYFAGAKVGSVIAGAKAPIVLTSRSDTAKSKLYSLALALSQVNKQ